MAKNITRKSKRPHRRGSGLPFGLFLTTVISGVVFAFTNIGGQTLLNLLQKNLRERNGLELTAESITGNPVRGYTVNNFALAQISSASNTDGTNAVSLGEKFFAAQSLSAKLSFKALLQGMVRFSELSVAGVDMDIDQFLTGVQKIKLPLDTSSRGGSKAKQFQLPLDRVSLTNSKFTSKSGHLEIEVSKIAADIANGRNNLTVSLNGRVNKVPVTGSVNLDVVSGTTISIKNSNVRFGQSQAKIFATGDIASVSELDSTMALNLQGAIQDLDLKDLAALCPDYLDPKGYNGMANVNVEAHGTLEKLRVVGTVDYKGQKIAGYPLERVGANVNYEDGRVSVTNIQALLFNIPIAGDAMLALPQSLAEGSVPLLLVELDGADAPLEGMIADLSGRVSSFAIRVQGPLNELTGTINLAAPLVSYQGARLTNIAAQVKLLQDNTAAVNGKFQIENAQGYVQGNVTSALSDPQLDLSVKLVNFDLRNLPRLAGQLSGRVRILGQLLDYDLTGTLDTVSIFKGAVATPKITGTFSSSAMKVTEQNSALELNLVRPVINFALNPGGTDSPKTTLNVSGTSAQILVADIFDVREPKLSIALAVDEGLDALDKLHLDRVGLDLNAVASSFIVAIPQSPVLALTNLAANGSGTAQTIKFDDIQFTLANVGGTAVTATGETRLKNSGELASAKFDIKADGLDLAKITTTIASAFDSDVTKKLMAGKITGHANLAMNLALTDDALTGTGAVANAATDSSINGWGLALSDVKLPIAFEYALNDKSKPVTITSSKASAKFYDGMLTNSFELALVPNDKPSTRDIKFTEYLAAENVDVNALIQTLAESFGGNTRENQITGRGKLVMSLSGTPDAYNGSGRFDMTSGTITGFKYLDFIARVHRTQGLRYASVAAPFELQPGKLILKSDTIAKAPDNDPIYKYAKLSGNGVIGFDTSLNLPVEMVVNCQLINALLGGGKDSLQGIADVLRGDKSFKDSLNAILRKGGADAQRQSGQGDYRTITMKLLGTFQSPSVRNFRIGGSTLSKSSPPVSRDQPESFDLNKKPVES